MGCEVSQQQLRLWIAGRAPELEPHLAECPGCRQRGEEIRAEFRGDDARPCGVSEEQLWLWIDDGAPELAAHLAWCGSCRQLTDEIRVSIEHVVVVSTPQRIPLPEKIGAYKVVRLVGEGAQGLIYEAEQDIPRRRVAIKVMRGGQFAGARDVERFQKEIQSLARLNHRGIAAIYDGGQTETGQLYFVMEYVDGLPLDAYVRKSNVPRDERLALFRKVCEAVSHAHEHNVIHRDLKPGNILIAADGQPKIVDFGLARMTDADLTLTTTTTTTASGQPLGTLQYMSPEQALGQTRQIDRRSDMYALGVILYELLVDRAPYPVSQFVPQAVKSIVELSPKSLCRIDSTVSRRLEAVVLKALEKDPARRYQTVVELEEDMRRYLAGELPSARPLTRLSALWSAARRHRLAVGVTTVTVVLALIGVWAGTYWRDRSSARDRAQRVSDARYAVLDFQRQLEAGRAELVLGNARSLCEQFPEMPEAQLLYAQAEFRRGQETGAPDFLNTAIGELSGVPADAPYAWAAAHLLAEIYRVQGRAAEADGLLARAEREMPDTAQGWYVRSFATLDAGKAAQYAARAQERAPSADLVPLIWHRLAYLRLLTADYDGALQAAEELVALGTDVPTWLQFAGHVLIKQGKYREAVDCYAKAASATDDSQAARFGAVAHLCLKEYREADEDYSRAIDRESSSTPWNRYMRATPRLILGRLKDAADDYRRFRELFRGSSCASARLYIVLQDWAHQLEEEGHSAEAQAARQEADAVLRAGSQEAAPGSWLRKLHECLAGLLTPQQLRDAAKKPAEICEGCYYAGEAARLQGHPDEAREWFRRCVNTDLPIDPHTPNPDPMNEYHLAVWRVDQLSPTAPASGPAPSP